MQIMYISKDKNNIPDNLLGDLAPVVGDQINVNWVNGQQGYEVLSTRYEVDIQLNGSFKSKLVVFF